MRLDLLGTTAVDCPLVECPIYQCYQECEHRGIVYDLSSNLPYQSQAFLTNLINAILEVQEEFIQQICGDITDVCELGFRANLECLQCSLTTYSLDPSQCPGYNILTETSDPVWVDLSSPDYIDLYSNIITWLQCSRGHASGELIDQLAQIFGGELLGYSDSTYHILMPNDPLILGLSTLIKRIMPAPFGAVVQIYTEI